MVGKRQASIYPTSRVQRLSIYMCVFSGLYIYLINSGIKLLVEESRLNDDTSDSVWICG
jgi:hypothetical protein